MKRHKDLLVRWAIRVLAVAVSTIVPFALSAQTCSPTFFLPGDKDTWETMTTQLSGHAYIDASQTLGTDTHDVCTAISNALTQLNSTTQSHCPWYSNGRGVIDARGVLTSGGGTPTFTCAASPFPAATSANQSAAYVTVMLPAGTIPITTPWYLPPNTRLIGESFSQAPTTIKAATGFSGNALIYMGDPPGAPNGNYCNNPSHGNYDCNGISIEHMALNGNSISGLDGILNYYAQELNYVDDVAMSNISGTGLLIEGQANNSGPYTKIYFSGTGTCVSINGTNNTRGLSGIDCYWSGSGSSPAAILVDGRNNTIEGVTISGYKADGIEIGSQAAAQDNLIANVTAASTVTNVVHIASTGSPTDLTMMGIKGAGVIIKDDVSGAGSVRDSQGYIALYILGEPVTSGGNNVGYSRFTTTTNSTTPSVPVWFQGAGLPTTTTSCTTPGSLYSVTSTSTTARTTLWGCIGGTWDPLSGTN